MTGHWRLIADIGGTNTRFARADLSGKIVDKWVQPVSAYPTFAAALEGYLETLAADAAFMSTVIAGAGPVSNDQIELTNNSWRISKHELVARLGAHSKVHIVNDLEAVAHAIPFLTDGEVAFMDQEPKPIEKRDRMLVVNIGTGFGSSNLIRAGKLWVSCPSESGHMSLGATNHKELELFERLGKVDLTTEDVLSGSGVRRLATILQSMWMETLGETSGSIEDFDLGDGGMLAEEVVRTLTGILARACSNLTLTCAAWDGVYICGSVATAWWQQADLSEFQRKFVGRSKMCCELERTPIGLITAEHPALIGLANMKV
jgi:glucokinase